ncbi:MAG: hypothetical protein IT376_07165 [Polyangiaceae bacterium]|nr:hypothetical protein [Polyangiaceae bacterium]
MRSCLAPASTLATVLAAALVTAACGSSDDSPGASGATGGAGGAGATDGGSGAAGAGGAGGALPTGPVHGWILLNADPAAVARSLEAAERFGVTHVQLSHDLVMDVSDVTDDTEEDRARLGRLNAAAADASARGMEVFAWTHEFDETGLAVCYDPDDSVWDTRAAAYAELFRVAPDLDGVVMMFGSASMPPWVTMCTCDYCGERWPDEPALSRPPQAERLRTITEQVGGAIVNELGKQLVARTFVHETAEIDWHADGFSTAEGVDFLGMHKAEVQDWQPYNPLSSGLGRDGHHAALVELDVGAEYWGLGELPFVAPEYYGWRLREARARGAIGTATRIERGGSSALGTPNELNLHALRRWLEDPAVPAATIWDEWLTERYGTTPGTPPHAALRALLADTFAVRTKSHYALGIWALEKGSDIPDRVTFDQLRSRGDMRKWDAEWAPIWEAVDAPDAKVVRWIHQEAEEACELAAAAVAALPGLAAALAPADHADLTRRARHQQHAADAWRAVDVLLFADRARKGAGSGDPELTRWMAWARADLARIRDALVADGLSDVRLVSPARVQALLDATSTLVDSSIVAEPPPPALFSAVRTIALAPDSATISFRTSTDAPVLVEWGEEIPDFGASEAVQARAGADTTLDLAPLVPGRRYFVRLTATLAGVELRSGVHWLFP